MGRRKRYEVFAPPYEDFPGVWREVRARSEKEALWWALKRNGLDPFYKMVQDRANSPFGAQHYNVRVRPVH